jgi:hypothetical protein
MSLGARNHCYVGKSQIQVSIMTLDTRMMS